MSTCGPVCSDKQLLCGSNDSSPSTLTLLSPHRITWCSEYPNSPAKADIYKPLSSQAGVASSTPIFSPRSFVALIFSRACSCESLPQERSSYICLSCCFICITGEPVDSNNWDASLRGTAAWSESRRPTVKLFALGE